jgi:hypothetical protein
MLELQFNEYYDGIELANRFDDLQFKKSSDINARRPYIEYYVYERSSKFEEFDVVLGKFVTHRWKTKIIYDVKDISIKQSEAALYTTLFILCLIVASILIFSRDVDNTVIIPIERMVQLVHKISENPLGVKYQMLGAKEGFYEGISHYF